MRKNEPLYRADPTQAEYNEMDRYGDPFGNFLDGPWCVPASLIAIMMAGTIPLLIRMLI